MPSKVNFQSTQLIEFNEVREIMKKFDTRHLWLVILQRKRDPGVSNDGKGRESTFYLTRCLYLKGLLMVFIIVHR